MICPRCGVEQDRSQFNRNTKKNPHCRTCRSHQDRLRRFNVTEVRYNKMLAEQGGVCAICKQEETRQSWGKPVALSVDHDHNCCPGDKSCGECVRALLCERCNRGIGMFEDSRTLLVSAINYLEEYNDLGSTDRGGSRRTWNIFDQVRRAFRQG